MKDFSLDDHSLFWWNKHVNLCYIMLYIYILVHIFSMIFLLGYPPNGSNQLNPFPWKQDNLGLPQDTGIKSVFLLFFFPILSGVSSISHLNVEKTYEKKHWPRRSMSVSTGRRGQIPRSTSKGSSVVVKAGRREIGDKMYLWHNKHKVIHTYIIDNSALILIRLFNIIYIIL